MGATEWLEELPALVASLEREWSITVGRAYDGGTEAFVAEATLADGTPAVLKLLVPRAGDAARTRSRCCASPTAKGARGSSRRRRPRRAAPRAARPFAARARAPDRQRHEILCATAQRMWRPAGAACRPAPRRPAGCGVDHEAVEELDRPCSERAVATRSRAPARRIAAHDDERAVLVHGDVHQWNALRPRRRLQARRPRRAARRGRVRPRHPHARGPARAARRRSPQRARWLAARTGLDADAIWEWGVVERVSTGLLCTGSACSRSGARCSRSPTTSPRREGARDDRVARVRSHPTGSTAGEPDEQDTTPRHTAQHAPAVRSTTDPLPEGFGARSCRPRRGTPSAGRGRAAAVPSRTTAPLTAARSCPPVNAIGDDAGSSVIVTAVRRDPARRRQRAEERQEQTRVHGGEFVHGEDGGRGLHGTASSVHEPARKIQASRSKVVSPAVKRSPPPAITAPDCPSVGAWKNDPPAARGRRGRRAPRSTSRTPASTSLRRRSTCRRTVPNRCRCRLLRRARTGCPSMPSFLHHRGQPQGSEINTPHTWVQVAPSKVHVSSS